MRLAARLTVLGVLALQALTPLSAAADTATPTPTGSPATPTASPGASPATTASAAGTPTPAPTDDPFRDREDSLALMLARARIKAGLLPLARSAALDRAAQQHAQDMAAQGYMDHIAPDGSTPASRAAQQGYETPPGTAWLVVETISAASDGPEGPMGFWLSDALHRGVVLRPLWREVGIGYAAGGPYGRFWVADFGCRPNMLPPVLLDGTLYVPDETCSHTSDSFGSVDSVRAAETSAGVAHQDWQSYTAQQPWPAGHPAVVDLKDASGKELELAAADPTGSPTSAPPPSS